MLSTSTNDLRLLLVLKRCRYRRICCRWLPPYAPPFKPLYLNTVFIVFVVSYSKHFSVVKHLNAQYNISNDMLEMFK